MTKADDGLRAAVLRRPSPDVARATTGGGRRACRAPARAGARRRHRLRLRAGGFRARFARDARCAGRARRRVLLPVALEDETGTPLPLQWGEYRAGGLVDARFGLREPAPPWLGVDAIAAASVVLVPALAVDLAGVRLGRGAGFYDRSLSHADPAARLIAVVRDDELVEWLPGDRARRADDARAHPRPRARRARSRD